MTVKLLHHTPLSVADTAISKCYAKEPYTEVEKQQSRIHRVANVSKHSSTIEHLVYSFDIDGISRAVLQELARHRIASYTVKSTRYTLKELKNEDSFTKGLSLSNMIHATSRDMDRVYNDKSFIRAEDYLVFTKDPYVDASSVVALENLRLLVAGIDEEKYAGKFTTKGPVPNDLAKYCLPEAYKTALVMTVNARALQNFLALRTDSHALWEIQDLARAMFEAVPDDHKFLYNDHVKEAE